MARAIGRWLTRIARDEVDRATRTGLKRIRKADDDETALVEIIARYGGQQAVEAAAREALDDDVRQAVETKEFRIKLIQEFKQDAVRRARRVSREARAEVNRQVRQIIREALDEQPRPTKGEIARRIRRSFFGPLEDRVYAYSPGRAEVIARTELVQAENTGIVEGYKEAGVEEIEWIAYNDGRSGDRHHERMNGIRIKIGEKFETPLGNELRYPGDPRAPIGDTVNCFPGDSVVRGGAVAATRRRFDGDLVTVTTSSGHNITATPNHPVLTTSGWVPISGLDEFHDIIDGSFFNFLVGSTGDVDHVPSTIEEKFDLVSVSTSGVNERAYGDFHGDVSDGYVDVVFSDGLLSLALDSKRRKGVIHEPLPPTVMDECLLFQNGSLLHLVVGSLHSSQLLVGLSGYLSSFLRAHLLHPFPVGFGSTAYFAPAPLEANRYAPPGDPVFLRKLLGALAGPVLRNDRRPINIGPLSAEHKPPFLEGSPDTGFTDSDLERDVRRAISLGCKTTRAVNKSSIDWSGHVYNLQTELGMYDACGIVVKNCRCTVRSVVR